MNNTNQKGGHCTRCETLPAQPKEPGDLYMWLPVGHTLHKVIHILNKIEVSYQLIEEGLCLKTSFDPENLEIFFNLLSGKMTLRELKETQVLWMPEAKEPQFQDFNRLVSLHHFMALSQSEWLLDLLANERIITYFQPIVSAQDTSKIFAQEALLRGVDQQNNLIPPGRIFSQAEAAGLVFKLDTLARSHAIRAAHSHGLQDLIFINFSPTSVYDPTTCLRMTVRAIDEAGFPHNNIVFEVAESEQPPDLGHLIKILKFYQDAGFRIALDDFGSGYSNLNLIHQLEPDFIKLDMYLIRDVHTDIHKAMITEKILEIAQRLEIETIAEGVESVEELNWVRERGATYVQGYLIAKPSHPPVRVTPQF